MSHQPLNRYDGTSFVDAGEFHTNSGAFAANGQFLPTHGINRPAGWYSADANKTFTIWQGGGDIAAYAAEYDHSTSEWSAPVRIGANPLTEDSHGAPTILRDATGTLHAFWGAHGSPLKHATSDNPDDTSAWTTQTDIADGVTYPHCYRLNNDDLYILYRRKDGTSRHIHYVDSADDGATWSTTTELVTAQTDEWLYPFGTARDGTDIHIAFARTENGQSKPRYDVYHVIHDTTDDSMRAMDGTTLSTPVTATERNNHCKVFDSGTEGTNYARVALDNGTPHLTFSHENAGVWEYRHSYWTGSGWNGPTTIIETGEQSANGDLLFVDGQLTKWLTVSTGTRGGHIEKWTYDGSWSKVTRVIEDTALAKAVGCPTEIRYGVPGLRMACSEIRLNWDVYNRQVFGVDETPVAGARGFKQLPLKRYDGTSWGRVRPTSTPVVDDFERGDLDPYTGDKGNAIIQDTNVTQGGYALRVQFSASGVTEDMRSVDGLVAYPEQGDTYTANVLLDMSASGGHQARVLYGVQDASNFYAYIIREGDVRIRKVEGGTVTDLYTSTVTVPTAEYLTVELVWGTDDTHTVTLTDSAGNTVDSGSGTDATWASGGVGWGARAVNGDQVTADFDNVIIQ